MSESPGGRPKHGGNRRETARRYGYQLQDLLDFSANVNPYGPPPAVYEAINEALPEIDRYPDNDDSLKERLAAYYEIRPENILLGNGAADLIYYLADRLRPTRALIPVPSFSEYEWATMASGGVVVRLPLERDFGLNTASLREQLPHADLVWLGNPNNPNGSLTSKSVLLSLVTKAPGTTFLIDEAFMDFVPQARDFSLLKEASIRPGLLVLRSLTKFFSLAGLRVGFLVGEKKIIEALEKAKAPWSLNCLALAGAAAALKDLKFAPRSRRLIANERRLLDQALVRTGHLTPFPSETNFMLVRIDSPDWDSVTLTKALAEKRILIRDASSFRGLDRRFIRLAVRQEAENLRLIQVLRDTMASRGPSDAQRVCQPEGYEKRPDVR